MPRLYLLFVIPLAVILCLASGSPADSGTWDRVLAQVPPQWRDGVARNLDLASAEWNDDELLAALQAYPPGTAKYRAVCFLIANMDKQLYVEYVNPEDPLNPFSPEDKDIDWAREYVYDYSTMTADLLIENVEWAFKVRQEFPWCRDLPESVFFDYVLPYRSTQEPVVSWRPVIYEDLAPMVRGLRSVRDVTATINRYNSGRVHFDPLYYRHPEDRDILTVIQAGVGRCEDMSNVSNYSLRAIGVATSSDFTPWWPKGDNNHAWNTIYENGTWHSFMGCEGGDNQGWDAIKSSTFAKVYRNSYSAKPIMGPAPDGTMPPRLMRSAAVDVTREYSTVSDAELDVDNPARATYLCVFNYGTWQAVAGAWAENGRVRFRDLGNHDILYCATQYIENETGWGDHFPVAAPFTLHPDGHIEFIKLVPRENPAGDIVLTGWNPTTPLTADSQVTLFVYSNSPASQETSDSGPQSPMQWIPFGTVTVADVAGTLTVTFAGAAFEDALYILSDSEDPDSLKEGSRPFVWKNGGITYY